MEEELSIFICPYCDIPMNKLPLDSKQLEIAAKDFDIDCEGEVKSVCYEDCLNKDTEEDVEDISENDTEIVLFSDSGDEVDDDDESHLRLKELYIKMVGCSLDEVMALDLEGNMVNQEEQDEPNRKLPKLEELGSDKDKLKS